LRDNSPNIQDEELCSEDSTLKPQDLSFDDCEEEISNAKDEMDKSTIEQSMFSHRRLRCRKEFQQDMLLMKWFDRRRYAGVSENSVMVGRSEPRPYGESLVTPSKL